MFFSNAISNVTSCFCCVDIQSITKKIKQTLCRWDDNNSRKGCNVITNTNHDNNIAYEKQIYKYYVLFIYLCTNLDEYVR